ncbi:MAG: cupin domain-containing protein [Bacteroidota bacterium]
MKSAAYWIDRLKLQTHPEGGYFREVYRSQDEMVHPVHNEKRNLATSIYFLLEGNNISHFHELDSDELWYFHEGSGAIIHVFEEGKYKKHLLSNAEEGSLQVLLPAGCQFAAEVIDQEGYVLMGCVVVPGFDFKDFRLLNKKEMMHKFPGYEELIGRFCID